MLYRLFSLKPGVLLLLCTIIWLNGCTNLFFQPMKDHLASPQQFGISYEDIYFNQEKGPGLHGWWFPGEDDVRAVVLFLHGNGENISTHSGMVQWLTRHGYDVFIFDYRGYGKSGGYADVQGAIDDIQSATEYVLSRKRPEQAFFVIGHSLGASLAIYSYAESDLDWASQPIDGMVLVSAFSEYPRIAREMMSKNWLTWLIQWPASLLVSSDFDPIDKVGQLPDIPKLFMHSAEDGIIDSSHVIDLYQQARGEKYLEKLRGHHNRLLIDKQNRQQVLHYLNGWQGL